MQVEREINNTPVIVQICGYYPGEPIRITGMGFGDADAPIPDELIYEVYDMDGNELDVSLDACDEVELINLYKNH